MEQLNVLLERDLNERSDFLRMYQEVVSKLPIPAKPVLNDPDRNRRVLVVDDDADIASQIRRILEGDGFKTETALDGFRAGALLGAFAPGVTSCKLMGLSCGARTNPDFMSAIFANLVQN
jgi:hypothetical protein